MKKIDDFKVIICSEGNGLVSSSCIYCLPQKVLVMNQKRYEKIILMNPEDRGVLLTQFRSLSPRIPKSVGDRPLKLQMEHRNYIYAWGDEWIR